MNYMSELAQGLVAELLAVVHKYDESMLLPTALGCLDIAKLQLLQDHMVENEYEH
jgi:hypothetical protein